MTSFPIKPEIKNLQSNQLADVRSAVKSLRSLGAVQDIPAIIHSLSQQPLPEARAEIISLLTDVKAPDAVDKFMEAFQSLEDEATLIDVTRICWESSLDFSHHLAFFSQLFTRASYVLAIECFTLIESTVLDQNIPSEDLTDIQEQIIRDISQMSPEKQVYAQTLIEFLA